MYSHSHPTHNKMRETPAQPREKIMSKWQTVTGLDHASEIYDTFGPTGEYVEVLRGEVRDMGGNVLFSGTAHECAREQRDWRIPTQLVPTETRPVEGEVYPERLWTCTIRIA